HLRRVGQRLMRMHEGLFGGRHGLVEEVNRRLRSCFADARLQERGLPHALLYWPITAGGLALAHPLLHVAAYLGGRTESQGPRMPDREEIGAYLWRRPHKINRAPLVDAEMLALLWRDDDGTRPRGVPREILRSYRRAQQGEDRTGLPTL